MQHVQITPTRTYKTAANAHKAATDKFGDMDTSVFGPLRYIVMQHTDGRFFPLFIGVNAMQYGVHFHFNIVAYQIKKD
jgi:hypothetical protein